jgi:hypothetical protein
VSASKIRTCSECSTAFDAGGGTRPPEVCSLDCRRKRQARHARNHYARRKADHERLKAIVEQLQTTLAV